MKAIVGKVGLGIYCAIILVLGTSGRPDALTTGLGIALTVLTLGILAGVPAVCGYLIASGNKN